MTSPRRIKGKTLVFLAAVLALVVVASCLFIGKMRERKPFVSKVVEGYRFRCTLSTDQNLIEHTSNASEETSTFSATPNPIREWITTRLFHQPPTVGKVFNGRPQLVLVAVTATNMPSFVKIEAGYPEPDPRGSGGIRTLTDKHFRLDGCPATVTKIEMPGPGKTARATILLVCTPDYAATYLAMSVAEPEFSDQADREMQTVISSFHIEKATESASDRR
jgi:hypothetical protein